jgi:hypothetical protein
MQFYTLVSYSEYAYTFSSVSSRRTGDPAKETTNQSRLAGKNHGGLRDDELSIPQYVQRFKPNDRVLVRGLLPRAEPVGVTVFRVIRIWYRDIVFARRENYDPPRAGESVEWVDLIEDKTQQELRIEGKQFTALVLAPEWLQPKEGEVIFVKTRISGRETRKYVSRICAV